MKRYLAHLAYHLGDALSAGLGLILAPFFVHPVDDNVGYSEAFRNGWRRGEKGLRHE